MLFSWRSSYLIARDGSGIKFKTEANQSLKWIIIAFVSLFFLLSNYSSFAELVFFRVAVLSFSFLSMLVIGSRKTVSISQDEEVIALEKTFFFFKKNSFHKISEAVELVVAKAGKKETLTVALKDASLIEVAIAKSMESENWQHEIKILLGIH